MENLVKKLSQVQGELKAPKGQTNKFGNYQYRSCEDILKAVKPLLKSEGLCLIISDSIEDIGGRIYVKATAQITDGKDSIYSSSYAREPESKKGADESQITGAASSYARKYALNGLFAIDDTKDADATNTHGKGEKAVVAKVEAPKKTPHVHSDADLIVAFNKRADNFQTTSDLEDWYASKVVTQTVSKMSAVDQSKCSNIFNNRLVDLMNAQGTQQMDGGQ